MSDLNHILFTSISFTCIIIGIILLKKYITKIEHKNLVLKISSILTLVFHFSSLYVDYFSGKEAIVEQPMLLPIYPCNVAMWLLVIVAFYKNRDSKLFEFLATITFYLGVFGGVIGITFNEIYIANPNLADWGVLKGLLSHVTLLFGCVYIFVGGYFEIRVANLTNVFLGMLLLLADGVLMIILHLIFNLTPPNAMYLLYKPFENIPWLNVITIGIIALTIIFIFTVIFEHFSLDRVDRWYNKLYNKFKNKRNA